MTRLARFRATLAIAFFVAVAGSGVVASPPPNVRVTIYNQSTVTLNAFEVIIRYKSGSNSHNPTSASFYTILPKGSMSVVIPHTFDQASVNWADGAIRFSDGRTGTINYQQFAGYWGVTMCGTCSVKYKADWSDYAINFTAW